MTEVLKAYMWGRADRLVRESGNKALLYSYSADGTPITTKEKVVKRLTGKSKVRRVGSSTREFLVQQGFVRCLDYNEAPQTVALLQDPTPLKGKDTWSLFACARAFYKTPLEQGRYEGINIMHVCFDRAIHGSLMRHLEAHMDALAEHKAGQLSGLQAQLLPLNQWFIGSGCCNHHTHNGLK